MPVARSGSVCRMETPSNLRYSAEHEWVLDNGRVRIGITAYAQDALGDVVFVELPEVGTSCAVGEKIAEVESTKSVSEIYAPVSGTIVEVNDQLDSTPELLNSSPYEDGWIAVIELSDSTELEALMNAEAYAAITEGD